MYVLNDGTMVVSETDSTVVCSITVKDVSERLKQLGYVVLDDDIPQVKFELEKIEDYVLNYCNITIIPKILYLRIIDRVACEFLFHKKNSGELAGFDYDAVIKEIKEGDTTLKYATGADGDTAESRFDKLLNKMERGFDKWCVPHRKLRW